jgi:hypothetical protein
MASIYAEKHNMHMSYITTYPPSGTHAFNTAWTTLHMLQERIHALQKSPQDIPIPRSPHTIGARSSLIAQWTAALLHDRDCPQANLILRGRDQDSHHPTGGYLPSYLVIGASL